MGNQTIATVETQTRLRKPVTKVFESFIDQSTT